MKRVLGFTRTYPVIKVLVLVLASEIIATGGVPGLSTALPAAIAALISVVSLTIINDYFDTEDDKRKKLMRPLARDELSRESAIALSALLFALSLSISAHYLNMYCTIIIMANTALTIAYSIYKEKAPVKELFRGYFNGSVILFGGLSTSPENPGIAGLILILSALVALTSSARKIAHNIDNEDGRKFTKITIATYYGDKTAAIVSSTMIIAAIFISIIPAAGLGETFLYMIGIADIMLAYSGLRLLVSTKYAIESHRFIKASMMLMIAAFLVSALI